MQRREDPALSSPGNPREPARPTTAPGNDIRRHELELSGRIQETLLLGDPPGSSPGLDVAVTARPSQHVGGDFYEFFQYGPHVHDVVVGDVMGKGFPAALVGAALKAQLLRHSRGQRAGEEHRPEGTPAWIMARVHQGIAGKLQDLGYFATMIYARVDLRRQRLTYVDCGHPPVLHYRAFERDVVDLPRAGGDLTNMPLGMCPQGRFRDMTVSFSAGDFLLFYTDGLTERLGARHESAGRERLRALVHQFAGGSAERLVEGIRAAADATPGDGLEVDDESLVVIKPGGLEAPARFQL